MLEVFSQGRSIHACPNDQLYRCQNNLGEEGGKMRSEEAEKKKPSPIVALSMLGWELVDWYFLKGWLLF